MTDHTVDRGAHTLWKSFIMIGCTDGSVIRGHFPYPVINLLGGNTCFDMFFHKIKHHRVDLTAFTDTLNLLTAFYRYISYFDNSFFPSHDDPSFLFSILTLHLLQNRNYFPHIFQISSTSSGMPSPVLADI